MGKRMLAFCLTVILCFQLLPVWAVAAEDAGSPKHIPRVVSIVFDDSGSMYENTDRWAYTSYAMQSFAAMMGSEDVLYITYLNGPAGTVKVDLSDGAKGATVSGFANIVFGGGTPNKVQQGAECLTREYAKYKSGAKYYLVVMADGELDSGLGKLSDKIAEAAASSKAALAGADFETVYFSMKSGDSADIPGAASHFAASSDKIVDTLKNVSADIMGRTAVKHTVSGNDLTFTLQYPALSIAVFAQKKNGDFKTFRATVKKDGKTLSCDVGNYSVKCPTKITKNTSASIFQEKIPENPPAGVVSLITNGGNPLAKGTYTVDVSGYGLQNSDVVVLVEPAVRIGCKYTLNDDDNQITFEELRSRISEGDQVTVECGLYEMNPDGSPGEAIPLDVLSPDYRILVNGKQVGSATGSGKHTYSFRADKSFENQQMKVEARLKGYQPFVLKETFGEFNIRIQANVDPDDKNEVALTKPMWKKWSAGQEGVSFPLKKADASVLERVAIAVEGCEGLPEGVCSALGKSVRVDGSTVVYLPSAQLSFSQLPESFTIALVDLETASPILTKTVKVIRPTYRFEIENPLADVALGLDLLKANTAAITFTLAVDYDGSGQYIPFSESDCEDAVQLTPDTGVLPGSVSEENGKLSFVPKYDPATDTVSVGDLVGKNHNLSVSTEVDGQKIQSETVTLTFSSAAYRLEVENEITQPLKLDDLKENQQKVIFRMLADYDGSGKFGELAQWDSAALEKLTIDAGNFPGKTETVYDAGGKPIGKAFIPQYDERNDGGIPFTAVAGKVHEILGTVSGTEQTASATVEVLAPDYELLAYKQGIEIVDVKLSGNTEHVGFQVLRDGRPLTGQELENLSSYALSFDKDQPWIRIETQAMEAEDGTAYLACTPKYGGLTFPGVWFWEWWLSLLMVKRGEMNMVMTLGEDAAFAAVSVSTSWLNWLILLGVVIVLVILVSIAICACTMTRISKGAFYKVYFTLNADKRYVISTVNIINPHRVSLKTRLRRLKNFKNLAALLVPFKRQRFSLDVDAQRVTFIAKKPIRKGLGRRTYPQSVAKENPTMLMGKLSPVQQAAVMYADRNVEFKRTLLQGNKHPETEDIHNGIFLTEGKNTIVLFLTKREQRDLRSLRRR